MKIAFTGASGTGKTVTAIELSKELAYPVNPVGSRSVAKAMGFASPYDADVFGKRKEFQNNLLKNKALWEVSNDSFVTDRTFLDNLTYSVMHSCVSTVDSTFIKECISFTERYDVIVFFPLEVFINTDGDSQRMENIEYHKTYQFLLKNFLDNLGKEYYTIKSNNLQERVREIRSWAKLG